MAINFPNNPAVNDTFTVGGTTFTFTGVKWESSAIVDLSSDTTPSLGGALDAGTHNINNVGVITATSFSGNVTGNLTGNADTATTATTATTASTATTATNAQGLTGDPSIQVTNATVLGNLDVQGTTTTIDTAVTEVDSLNVEGSVGIGTTNPVGTLEIDAVSTTNMIMLDAAGTNFARVGHNTQSGTDVLDVRSEGHTRFLTNGNNERLRITSSGVVGINTDVSGNDSGAKFVVGGRIQSNAGGYWFASASGAEDGWHVQDSSGNLTINESGVAERLRINSSGNVVANGTISDSMGPLRRLGINYHNAATYTLVAGDAGKLIREATNGANITIPQNVFVAGDMISIFNASGGDNTITQGTGITLYNTADGSSGNRTLAAKGVCTIVCASTNEFIISGSQLS